MDAVRTVEDEVRELIRRSGLDPVRDEAAVQQLVRATWGDRRGIGVLEQLAIGDHEPSGLRGLFDGAAGAPG